MRKTDDLALQFNEGTAISAEALAQAAGTSGRGRSPVVALESGERLPCRIHDPDLWFAEAPAELDLAKLLCRGCPIRHACLIGALSRREPWGVWGGEIVERGSVIARKRPRGRPRSPSGPRSSPPCMEQPARTGASRS